jgi:hypothetical protein
MTLLNRICPVLRPDGVEGVPHVRWKTVPCVPELRSEFCIYGSDSVPCDWDPLILRRHWLNFITVNMFTLPISITQGLINIGDGVSIIRLDDREWWGHP